LRAERLKSSPVFQILWGLPVLVGGVLAGSLSADEKLGVRVPDGFEVTLYADDDLAHNVFSMTIDSLGRVVVSGPGYVRILIDSNGDGKADTYKQFADGPATGAQGMFFHGRDLLCAGDAGLIRYRDDDGDDRADGPPDTFLKVKAGGEHHLHAIQKGPDGWWYIIAGNDAGVNDQYITLPTSPVKQPAAGTLMRLKPDLSGGEIFADGFRNAYDFSFNRQGDIFTFDSDGERDISLPWYLPTRVFHVLPGSHAGWVSRSWKRPDYFLDMPPVVGDFGRGSPTGVVTYQHRHFPEQYHDALFILDWTFGRVFALPLEKDGETWNSTPINFMSAVGQFGFAPTDVEVGPDGSLFISVGGRGTRGGVYRITHSASPRLSELIEPTSDEARLTACLNAPQPLSSWSRTRWMPWAKKLGRQPFVNAARNEQLSEAFRVRAIEILTELFDGLDEATAHELTSADSAAVRARAVWSLGRTQTVRPPAEVIAVYLKDPDPMVGRFALEALLGAGPETDFSVLVPGLARQMGGAARFNRLIASRVVPLVDRAAFRDLALAAAESGWQAGLTNAWGYLARSPQARSYALKVGVPVLEDDDYSPDMKLQAARLLQLALGDLGSGGKLPPVFDGYASPLNLQKLERELDPLRIVAARSFPSGHRELDQELARLLAMLTPYNPKLLDRLLAQITEESNPIDDIHYLIVASRIPTERGLAQREIIAKALVDLEPKIRSRKLNQDTNWDNRVGELYQRLVELDRPLPLAMLQQPSFGRPGHVMFLAELPEEHLEQAVAVFLERVEQDPDYQWTNGVVFVVGEGGTPRHLDLVRRQYENFSVRNAVLLVLAAEPEEQDRPKFLEGLESSQLEILTACLEALEQLPKQPSAEEDVALLKTLRRLGANSQEYVLRERVVRLLQRNTGEEFEFEFGERGYRPQPEAVRQWTAAISEKYPQAAASRLGGAGAEIDALKDILAQVDWDAGDAERGRQLFHTRSCIQCHGGQRALGPDLAGVANRFSREDLFKAIVLPDLDVSPRYQTTLVETKQGKVYSGLIIYEAVDGITLRNATNQTFRIEGDDIESQRKLSTSLMPAGLLKDLGPEDYADLYTYIRSLGNPQTANNAPLSEPTDGSK
jgi:putative membrane-bound dehydrogenase-like protein